MAITPLDLLFLGAGLVLGAALLWLLSRVENGPHGAAHHFFHWGHRQQFAKGQ